MEDRTLEEVVLESHELISPVRTLHTKVLHFLSLFYFCSCLSSFHVMSYEKKMMFSSFIVNETNALIVEFRGLRKLLPIQPVTRNHLSFSALPFHYLC
jgi:hypothetical protein